MSDPSEGDSARLDAAMAARGLARSRTTAARLIAEGLVSVDGATVVKSSVRVLASQSIEVASSDHYVSRAAHKLLAALDAFPVTVKDTVALDVGASTGGFTQVLLERGARRVIALDVGHAQLHTLIRSDERVSVVEGFNARYMTAETLAGASGIDEKPTVIVADLSFISLPTVLPAIVAAVGADAEFIVLVKPQFEVGRTGIKEGIVRTSALRAEAIMGVLWAAWDQGLPTAGLIPSPIVGASGNHEFVAWLSAKSGSNPTDWRARVDEIA
jgi:23S rRNA (cytidine1920-2'-O)/16S rRNA (cytidine1409-2'-O)-methyltransferase